MDNIPKSLTADSTWLQNQEIFDLAGIPPFNQDLENRPAERVMEFKAAIRAAAALEALILWARRLNP